MNSRHPIHDNENFLAETILLHQSDSPWVPSRKRDSLFTNKDRLAGHIQAVLNKLTFEKFNILLAQINNMKINSIEDLDLIVDAVYENAINEPHFSMLYSNLCRELQQISVPSQGVPDHRKRFRNRFLTKCQTEFEKLCIQQANQSEILLQETECNRAKMKRRHIGTIKFIGELLKSGLLRNPIMHEIINKLFTLESQDSLEYMCQLFRTAGKSLDEDKRLAVYRNGSLVDAHIEKMKYIVDKRSTSTRVRFMLLDVIELKENNWIPRRREDVPKTINEIHQEIENDMYSSLQNILTESCNGASLRTLD